MILQFSSRRQILRKDPGRSILRREVASSPQSLRVQHNGAGIVRSNRWLLRVGRGRIRVL